MANTLTNLIPDFYEALDVVSREMSGFIPAVSTNNSVERAALDQTVYVPITEAQSAADNTPAAATPDTGDQKVGNTSITIDNSKHVPIRWNGEQTKGYKSNGTFSSTLAQQTYQAMRTIVNLVEADIAAEYILASRGYGTSGTTPFATDLSELANMKKILNDNGAPTADRQCVIDSAAMVNLLGLTNLTRVDAAGSSETLRDGKVTSLFGFDIYESSQVQDHTKGTATGFDCTAIEPIGETTIACDGSDSGTVLAGDLVINQTKYTAGTDLNQYVVNSGSTLTGNASGNFIINKPGMKVATAVADEWTIQDSYTANMCFSRSAIQLATRMPAVPDGGDQAIDSFIMTDPVTGLSFEIALYPQYLQNVLHVRLAWGTKLIKPEHTAILIG